MIRAKPILVLLSLTAPSAVAAQTAFAGGDSTWVVADSADVRGAARVAQANFERRRSRTFPITIASGGGPCDETVGRFCLWHGEGEWIPTPEPEEARSLRRDLLSQLDSLQRWVPGDGWILGQRVWYRAEAEDWTAALATAAACGAVPRWWCSALQGFALHGLGRYEESLEHFERALRYVDPERGREWRLAERVVGRDVRGLLRDREREHPDSLARTLDRMWRLADPLYLVAGNDRRTAHYARWTVATLKDGARNPFRASWGRDLEELTVRHGWEVGWERSLSPRVGGPFTVTGHRAHHSREYLPSREVLEEPGGARPEDFVPRQRGTRSLYQPRYAPLLLPMDGQLARFPRTRGTVVVATLFLPPDTTVHATHDHERPWLDAGDQEGMPDRVGLFAVPVDGGPGVERRRSGSSEGALMLEVPEGPYVISAESWSPERRRAGRLRLGLDAVAAPEDVATLSDLLLLSPHSGPAGSLAEALPAALLTTEVRAGDDMAIAWEVSGLGFRPETFRFEVSLDRTDRGVFRRVGELLGLSERAPTLVLSWEEPGPDRPTHHFRYLDLDLPELDARSYRITLTLRTSARSDAITTKDFRVVER